MLFAYTYVPHPMERMQECIDFIFFEVWCKALSEEYGIHLFESFEPLHQIMNELNRKDLASKLKDGAGKWFYESVNEIFNEFKKLDEAEIEVYKQLYQVNNLIEDLCSNDSSTSPIQYSDLNPSNTALNSKLTDFFQKLYASGFFGLSVVKKALDSDLLSFYNDFVRSNNSGYCAFCGLLPIDNEFDPTREAFDHYLPKSKYPFNSVNLKNLAPSCYKCNSGNKNDKDPLHDNNDNRRKAFYPFSRTHAAPQIIVDVLSKDWVNQIPEDFEISIFSASHSEEVATWIDLFRIKDRYRARCHSASGGLYWRKCIFEEGENYALSIKEMLDAEIQSAGNNPWTNSNFLKKAFLEGCQRARLFDNFPMNGTINR